MIAIPIVLTCLTVLAFAALVLAVMAEAFSPIHHDENLIWPAIVFVVLLLACIGAWVWL